MPWIAAGAIGGALISAQASKSAAQTQATAADNAAQQQYNEFNTINSQEQPYIQSGYAGLNQISADMPYLTQQFNATDLTNGLSPNYNFSLQQGQGANANLLNSTGGRDSGNFAQGLDSFTQNYAQGAYQQAYNNFTGNQTNIYNRLASIAGIGQTGQTQANQAGIATTNAATGYQTGAAAASAAGTVGAANAISGGLQTAGFTPLLSSMYGNQNAGGSGPSGYIPASSYSGTQTAPGYVAPLNNSFDAVGG